METKLPSSLLTAEAELLTLDPITLDPLIAAVADPRRGAVVTFSGTVRDTEDGAPIRGIVYDAYEGMARDALLAAMNATQRRWGVKVAVRHRFGPVAAGEASLLVACAGVHRRETFEACAFVVEEIKKTVPIWKVRFEPR